MSRTSNDAAILWIHGGGLFLGRADRDDPVCAALAQQHRVTVVAVDYRLAPEHPYPAALEDCYAALSWISQRFGRIAPYAAISRVARERRARFLRRHLDQPHSNGAQ